MDKYLGTIDETITVSIVGGAAFIMKGWIDRQTRDIDSISMIDKDLTNAAYTGKVIIDQEELEDKILDIWEDLRASIERVKLWDRQMEIIEFYRGMGWNYEGSKIQKLFKG